VLFLLATVAQFQELRKRRFETQGNRCHLCTVFLLFVFATQGAARALQKHRDPKSISGERRTQMLFNLEQEESVPGPISLFLRTNNFFAREPKKTFRVNANAVLEHEEVPGPISLSPRINKFFHADLLWLQKAEGRPVEI
jgi:hypothetical protein